jgi:hypothetical protein
MIPKPETILNIIGPQPYSEMLLIDRQDTSDIVEALLNKHEACINDYDKFAYLFDGGTVLDICRRLYDFCRLYLDYNVESTKAQYTSKPGTILRRGYADCKCYALFCGGVLDALSRSGEKINWCFRFASYKLFSKRPYHVFIVVNYYGTEIYIDPVFSRFDYRKPGMWLTDYDVSVKPAQIAGMCCDQSGQLNVMMDGETATFPPDGFRERDDGMIGTTAETGAAISKVAPALAVIPVVGWIAAAGGTLIGGFLQIFGNKYHTSTNVRWLTAKYQRYVLGDGSATSDNHVNEGNTENAQKWFSYVLGVPIYDQLRYHALRGTSPTTGKSLNISRDQRAQNYLNSLNPQEKTAVTYAQALAATYPADQFKENGIDGDYPPGSWKGFTAAPSLIDQNKAATTGTGALSSLASLFSNKWILLLIIGAAVGFVVTSKPKGNIRRVKNSPQKKRTHGKR